MKFSRRHYEVVADWLNASFKRVISYGYKTSQTLQELENDIISTFIDDNPRFEEVKFRNRVNKGWNE